MSSNNLRHPIDSDLREKAIGFELSRLNMAFLNNEDLEVGVDSFLENAEKIAQYLAGGPSNEASDVAS